MLFPEPGTEDAWRASLNMQQQHLRELEEVETSPREVVERARRRVERIWQRGRPEWRAKGWDRRWPWFLKDKPVEKPE